MPRARLAALAGGRSCVEARHKLKQDRNVVTAPDGSRVTEYWCDHVGCPRYAQAVASRPA